MGKQGSYLGLETINLSEVQLSDNWFMLPKDAGKMFLAAYTSEPELFDLRVAEIDGAYYALEGDALFATLLKYKQYEARCHVYKVDSHEKLVEIKAIRQIAKPFVNYVQIAIDFKEVSDKLGLKKKYSKGGKLYEDVCLLSEYDWEKIYQEQTTNQTSLF